MIKVYAAGSMTWVRGGPGGKWRSKLPHLPDVQWLIPRPTPGGTAENKFQPHVYIPHDFFNVQQCDVLLAVFEPGATERQAGTCTEVGLARAWDKPIVAVCPDETAREEFHFPLWFALTVVQTIEEAIEVIRFMAGTTGTNGGPND